VKALIVDSDPVLADVVAFALRREGFQVIQVYDGLSALHCWSEERPDLVVLDVNLPEIDGFAVCQRIRKAANTPIIILTDAGGDDDVIRGLELGADVYMTKPFSPRQLVARARAVLRRAVPAATDCSFGVEIAGAAGYRQPGSPKSTPAGLTPLERRLLDYLKINSGQILSSKTIIAQVWGPGGGDLDMLRHLIRRLRSKIEPDPAHPVFLKTFPGQGYGLFECREGNKTRH
jgi:DNA-binding response OmpR family regulator